MRPDGLYGPWLVPYKEFVHSARFGNAVETMGVEVTNIECLPNGRRGFLLSLAGGEWEYEVRHENNWVKLGRSRLGKRELLAQGGPAVEATWQRFAEAVRISETAAKQGRSRIYG